MRNRPRAVETTISFLPSFKRSVTNNAVTDNGFNNASKLDPLTNEWVNTGLFDAGIALLGQQTIGNRISQNTVQYNCGDGVAARDLAAGNTISNNTVRDNPIPGTTGNTGSCRGAPPNQNQIVTYDLAARDSTVQNRWSKTNDCHTFLGILPGVCNPGE